MEERIKKILARILKMPIEDIGEETSPDTVDTWDSLRHMNLVMALEEEFGVRFKEVQVVEMLNYPLIVATLREMCVT